MERMGFMFIPIIYFLVSIGLLVLGVYALILLIKALKIYINKNS